MKRKRPARPPKGHLVGPPPRDGGTEPLFRVVYAIDVNAPNAREAAEQAHGLMTEPDAMRPILTVIDRNGRCEDVDLNEITEEAP